MAESTYAVVKRFSRMLYPECLAPVEFIDYQDEFFNVNQLVDIK